MNTAPNYDGRRFGPDRVSAGSVLGRYRQSGQLVTAEFSGAAIRTGRLVGLADPAGVIEAAYCQVMADGQVIAGRCTSTPSVLEDGRIALTEQWQRNDGSSGVSRIVELAPALSDPAEGPTADRPAIEGAAL